MTELEKNLNEIENMFKAGIIDVNDYKQMKLQITASIENIAIVETPSDGQPPLPGRTAPSPDSPKLHVSINGAEAVIYERDEVLSFWMKNTYIPLSIAFITYEGRIIEIKDMYPHIEISVTSSRSVRYALEVPQGWFSKTGIREGDIVVMSN